MHKEKGRFLYLKLIMHDNDTQIIFVYLSKIVKHSTFGKVLVSSFNAAIWKGLLSSPSAG